MGRTCGPVHECGPRGDDDVAPQARRPARDPNRAEDRLPVRRRRVTFTFTPRRRALIALIAFVPIASLYGYFAIFTLENMAREYRAGYAVCDDSWRGYFNNCGGKSYNMSLAWFEMAAITALLLVIAYGLARWVVAPIRGIADAVSGFGPTSLGLRLRASGPRDETRALSDAVDAMLDRLAA